MNSIEIDHICGKRMDTKITNLTYEYPQNCSIMNK